MRNYIIISIFTLFTIGNFANCNEGNEKNQIISLDHNNSYYNPEKSFTLQLDSVLSDSRCPTGAVCIWAGNAEIRIKVITNNNDYSYIHLNSHQSPNDTLLYEYRIKLVKLLPYPVVEDSINQKDYVAQLLIEKN